MFLCCWSPKGGSGTSVVAAGLALVLANVHGSSLLVDLAGDARAVLGLSSRDGSVSEGVSLLSVDPQVLRRSDGAAEALVAQLRDEVRPVVVDLPTVGAEARADRPLRWFDRVSEARSVLVVRPCYLALRRVTACDERPDAIVVVTEPGRALRSTDVCEVVGAPLLAEVPLHPSIARVVDAGLLAGRLPGVLERALGPVATEALRP